MKLWVLSPSTSTTTRRSEIVPIKRSVSRAKIPANEFRLIWAGLKSYLIYRVGRVMGQVAGQVALYQAKRGLHLLQLEEKS